MGIEYVLDVRHPHGRADRWCPRIRCDICGEFIEGGSGNVWWKWEDGPQRPLFTHKICPTDGRHHEPEGYALSEELTHFLVYLVENAGVNYAKERPLARKLAAWE